MRRALLLSAVILTALILQTTVFSEVNLLGAKPELMFLLTICFAISLILMFMSCEALRRMACSVKCPVPSLM